MTPRYYGDRCPACRSYDVTPYAIIVGGSEEYGYQCQECQVMWPVLSYPAVDTPKAAVVKAHAA